MGWCEVKNISLFVGLFLSLIEAYHWGGRNTKGKERSYQFFTFHLFYYDSVFHGFDLLLIKIILLVDWYSNHGQISNQSALCHESHPFSLKYGLGTQGGSVITQELRACVSWSPLKPYYVVLNSIYLSLNCISWTGLLAINTNNKWIELLLQSSLWHVIIQSIETLMVSREGCNVLFSQIDKRGGGLFSQRLTFFLRASYGYAHSWGGLVPLHMQQQFYYQITHEANKQVDLSVAQ